LQADEFIDVNDAIRAVTGTDQRTGKELSTKERLIAASWTLLNIIPVRKVLSVAGKVIKYGGKMAEGVDYVTASFKGVEVAEDGTVIGKQVGPGKLAEWVHARHAESSKKINDEIQGIEASLAKGTGDSGGRFPTKLIDPEADKHIIDKVAEARGGLSNKYKERGNFAYAEVNVTGVDKTDFYAHSGIHNSAKGIPGTEEFSFKPENPVYKATEAPDNAGNIYLRDADTEYKILNDVANRLGGNKDVTGTIRLFTEKDTCGSCNKIIQQFQKDYPNIKVEVLHNGDIPILLENSK